MGTTTKPWIQTATERVFNFLQPDVNDVCIRDIAHALSNICRFTGHVGEFYSVAQHSVLVSYLVNPIYAREALMHDASEAYLGDVNSPLKHQLPEYQKIEAEVMRAVEKKFELVAGPIGDVVRADEQAFKMELVRFFHYKCPLWLKYVDNPKVYTESEYRPIIALSPADAREAFIARYHELFEADLTGKDPIQVAY